MNDLVVINKDNELTTTSRKVAEVFKKQHDDVLKSIKKIECSDEFRLGNFSESSYTNQQNKVQPMYELTRDGLTFLCMGYTGKKAAKFKEMYIAEFNRMEQHIKDQQQAILAKPMNMLEMIANMALEANETNKRQEALAMKQVLLEAEQLKTEERLRKVECKQITSEEEDMWYTARGYASLKGYKNFYKDVSKRIGNISSFLCRQKDIEPRKLPDSNYGQINSYPVDILESAFDLYFNKKTRSVLDLKKIVSEEV